MFESTAKLRDYLIQMVDVDILKEDGKSFKNLKDIVIELGEAFEKNNNEFIKQEVAEKLAGKTQMNVLLSAISNYKQIKEAYETAIEAEGSAAREQEHYAESIQYSLDRFKAALQELAATFLDSDMVKQIVEFGIVVVEKLTEFVRGNDGFAKGLVAIFAGLTGLKDLLSGGKGLQSILSFFIKINEFDKINPGSGFADVLINSLSGVSDIAKNASVDIMQLSGTMTEAELNALRTGSAFSAFGTTAKAAITGLGTALKALLPALAIGAVVVGVAVAWDKFTTSVKEAESAAEETLGKVSSLKTEIEKLESIDNRTVDQQKRLESLKNELSVQEAILKIEQQRVALEKYGNKFSDLFDEDNYNNILIKESDPRSSDSYKQILAKARRKENNLAENRTHMDSYGQLITSGTTSKWVIDNYNKYESKVRKDEEDLADLQLNLSQKHLEYLQYVNEIQADIDGGFLSGAALDRAVTLKNQFVDIVKEIEIYQKKAGTFDQSTALGARAADYTSVGQSIVSIAGAAPSSIEEYEENYKRLTDYVANNVTPQQEELWITATQGAQNATEAIRAYEEAVGDTSNKLESIDQDFSIEVDMSSLKTGFDAIQKLYSDFESKKENGLKLAFDYSSIQDLKTALTDANGELQVSQDIWDNFEKTLSNGTSTTQEVQDAFNELAASLFQGSETIRPLSDETRDLYVAQLELMGVENAAAVVDNRLAVEKQKLQQINIDLADSLFNENGALKDNAEELLNESNASDTARQAIAALALAKIFVNGNGINTSSDIDQIIALANAAGAGITALNQLAEAKKLQGTISSYQRVGIHNADEARQYQEAQKALDGLNNSFKETTWNADDFKIKTTSAGKAAKATGGAAKDAAKETDKLSSSLENAAQAYNDLKEITDAYNKNGKISFDQAKKLADMDLRYLATLKLEGKQLKLNTDSWNNMAKAQQVELKISMYRKAIDLIKTLSSEAKAEEWLANANLEVASSAALVAEEEYNAALGMLAAQGQASATAAEMINLAMANAMAAMNSIDLSTFSSLGSEIGSAVGESASEEFEKEIDWVERRIEVLDKRLELLKAKYENTTSRGEKFKNLTRQIHVNLKELNTYNSAVDMYREKYQSYLEMLPEDIQDKVKHGAVDILTLTGEEGEEMSGLIDKTQEWWEKLKNAKIKIQEIQTEIANLALEKLTAIKDQLDFDISGETHLKNMIDKLKELAELRGETPDFKEYYSMSKKYLEADLAYQEEAITKYNKKINRMLKKGRITIDSDQYKEAVQGLRELEEAAMDTRIQLQELNNEANSFENTSMSAHIEDLNYQLEILELQLELLSDTEAEGAQGTEIYAQSALQCKEAIRELTEWLAELKRQYESGAITLAQYTAQTKQAKKEILTWEAKENSYYKKIANNRKKELQDQTKAISEETKAEEKRIKAIIDGIKNEIDSYKSLIKSKQDALDAEKSLHDYRKSIEESNKDIVSIERQLAALSGDQSQSAIAKRKKLEQDLYDKKEELREKEYDHQIEAQKESLAQDLSDYEKRRNAEIDNLNDSLDAFKDAQDAKTKIIQDQIDDEQALLAEARAQVESDWDAMYADLKAKCEEHGISIEEIISTWDDSLTPLENYLNMLDLIQEKIDEMNDSSVNLQYGEQQQQLKAAMEQADAKIGQIKDKLSSAKAAGDEKKVAKLENKLDKWTDRYNAYKRQYDALVKGEGILARDEIELTGKTFEENNQKIGTSAANTIMNMLKQNATYEDDTHKMLDATNADWSKANKNKYANLISMLDNSVDSCDDAMNIVKGDSEQISTAIFEIAQQHGLDITDIITGSWNESISTLDNYRALLVEVLRMAAEAGQIDFNTGQKINTSTGGSSTSTSTTTSTSTPVSSAGRTKAEVKADIQDVKAKIERAKTNIKNNPGSERNIIREQKIAAWEQELEELKEEKKSIPKYASGLRSATKAHLGLTNEAGREVIVTKNGILTPLQKGDAVLSAAQTKNLFDLAKIDASAILKGLAQQAVNVPQSNVNNVNTLQIDNLVTITGQVTPDLIPTVREEVEKGLKNMLIRLNKGVKY